MRRNSRRRTKEEEVGKGKTDTGDFRVVTLLCQASGDELEGELTLICNGVCCVYRLFVSGLRYRGGQCISGARRQVFPPGENDCMNECTSEAFKISQRSEMTNGKSRIRKVK